MSKNLILIGLIFQLSMCTSQHDSEDGENREDSKVTRPFTWKGATIYFLMTDRFNNGDVSNDQQFNRVPDGGVLRSFMGGDLKGITAKIKEGYFDKLGINAIWFTPVVEQIHQRTDEGFGGSYAFHGYWTRDWTALDPNFGSMNDLRELVEMAHAHEIRILLDVVINHTGPVTTQDTVWPDGWVRTGPRCINTDYETTVGCALTDNLPDIRTESDQPVQLPEFLITKWETEGRLDQELKELDDFFARTGYPRAPRFYIIKWLCDYIRELGVDGFRVDTTKHTEASIWAELKKEILIAYEEWKANNPDKMIDDRPFFMVGEVFGYSLSNYRNYDYSDVVVDFFDFGFESLINFGFKSDAAGSYDSLFSNYSAYLNSPDMEGASVLNYVTSHDDSEPFDSRRAKVFEAGTKLLLCPGAAQVYYGDETSRPLIIEGALGDATLRSFMNWSDLERNIEVNGTATQEILGHWQKLGQFRRNHMSVGAGIHTRIQDNPYVFSRTLDENGIQDQVVVGLDLPSGRKVIPVMDIFDNGSQVLDYYSEEVYEVQQGQVIVDSPFDIVLLAVSNSS